MHCSMHLFLTSLGMKGCGCSSVYVRHYAPEECVCSPRKCSAMLCNNP
jgi:hypothetical protein